MKKTFNETCHIDAAPICESMLQYVHSDLDDFHNNTHGRNAKPNKENANDLIMSHSSVTFDRSGFAEDVNVVYPIDRFKELVTDGSIGTLADVHYSFMGAGLLPEQYEQNASKLAGMLKKDRVDAAFLTPV